MSSPFSKIFSAKNPIRKENSNVEEPKKPEISDAERTGISDEQHHAISSNTDANSVMILVDKKEIELSLQRHLLKCHHLNKVVMKVEVI